MAGFGVLGLITKLHKWDESAMFFDGSSLGTKPFPNLSLPMASSDSMESLSPYVQLCIYLHLVYI